MLARVLAHAGEILSLSNVTPTREADVQKEVHRFLQLAYPDALREISIPQPTKTYKPDIGIESLKVAIELKFADSVEEGKKAIGELYTDMIGFNGNPHLETFYGVVYMTGPHLSQQVLNAEMARVGTPKNWHTMLVHGQGSRKKKKASQGAAKAASVAEPPENSDS